jgi:type IV pilus assembly protein PilM
MGWNPFTKGSINLFIDDQAIRCLELYQANPLSVTKISEQKLPEGIIREGKINDRDGFLIIIKNLVKAWKLNKRKLQFIIPDALVVIRKIEVAKSIQVNELHSHLALEIGTSIHLPFDEPVFDTHYIREASEFNEILLFAAPKQPVNEYVELFQEVNFKPFVVDISSICLYRLYHKLNEQATEDDHILMLQIGSNAITTTIFNNNLPLFMRHFTLNQEMSATTDTHYLDKLQETSYVQEIIAELERISNFYRFSIHQGTVQLTKVIITGEDNELQQMQQQMESALGIPVTIFEDQSIRLHRKSKKRAGISLPPVYYPVLGLALKEV